MSNRIDTIAKVIADWFLNGAEADHPVNEPFAWKDDDSILGVDGRFDCKKLAAAIDAALAHQDSKP